MQLLLFTKFLTKIVYVYIVYLDAWPRNSTNNFNFRNCLFGVNKLVKNSDKEKYVHSGYGIITFNSAGSWRFSNDFAKNVIICNVDNSLSSHSDNCKNNFLLLGEVPTHGINGSFGLPETKFSIDFAKANTKLWVYMIEIVIS